MGIRRRGPAVLAMLVVLLATLPALWPKSLALRRADKDPLSDRGRGAFSLRCRRREGYNS